MADAHTSPPRPLGVRTPRLTWLMLAVALVLLAAGTAPALGQAGTPSVRFVHVSPGTPLVNATLEGQPLAEALAYGATSNRLPFPGGTVRLRVSAAEEPSRVLLDAPIDLPLDGPATVLLIGRASGTPSLAALILSDYLGQSTQDRTRVRFVNAEVGGGAVSLISGQASTLFEDIGYGGMGDAVLDPATLSLRVVRAGTATTPVAETQLNAEPGRSYTIVLIGQAGGSEAPRLLVLDHSRAAGSRAASSGPAAPGTILVDETFTDPVTGVLPATAPEGATLLYGYADGEYWLRNLEVATQSLAVPVDATNATIAADARLIGETTRRTVSVGCRFGSDSSGNRGYRLRVEPGAGLYRLVREDGPRDTFLRRDSRSPAIRAGNESNRLEITCSGSTVTASINGVLVASVQDSTYTSGSLVIGVGARASGLTSEARFDNLVVTAR